MAGTVFSDHGEEAEARELWQTLTGSKSHCQTERTLPVCSLAFGYRAGDHKVPDYHLRVTGTCGCGSRGGPIPSEPSSSI